MLLLPYWHARLRNEESLRESSYTTNDRRHSVGNAWHYHDEKCDHGDPSLIDSNIKYCHLNKHPQVV